MSKDASDRWVLVTQEEETPGLPFAAASAAAGYTFKSPPVPSGMTASPASSSTAAAAADSETSSTPTVPALVLDLQRVQSLLATCPLEVSRLVGMDVLPSHLHHMRELQLADRSKLHLVVAPPPPVPLLRHEQHALETEAIVLNLLRASGVPVAQVIRYEPTDRALGAPFLLTSSLAGAQLSKVLVSRSAPAGARRSHIETQLQRLLDSVTAHTALSFGPIPVVATGKGYETWSDAFRAMLGDAIKDAEDGFVHLPYSHIWKAMERAQAALDGVQASHLVVPGLSKPSSVLVEPTQNGHYRICGLMGFQNAFWGDPEMGKIIEGHPPGPPSESSRLGPAALARGSRRDKLLLYSMYRSIVAITTACYRPYGGGQQEVRARKELTATLEQLANS